MTKELLSTTATQGPVLLHSSGFEVVILPQRGYLISQIRSITYDCDLLWTTPEREPFRHGLGPPGAPSIDTFHRSFAGGWFAMIPTAGLPGEIGGVMSWHHGEAARVAWDATAISSDRTHLTAEVNVANGDLNVIRTVEAGRTAVIVTSRLTNVGNSSIVWSAGEHPCFDRATFAGGRMSLTPSRSWIPAPHYDPAPSRLASVDSFDWPYVATSDARTVDLSLIPETRTSRHEHVALALQRSDILLPAPRHGLTVRLSVSPTMPYLLLWQKFDTELYDVFALEPCTSAGRSVGEAFAQNSMRKLDPGCSVTLKVVLEVAKASRSANSFRHPEMGKQ